MIKRITLLIPFIFLSLPSLAANQSSVSYEDWVVYAKKKESQLYCFMVSSPKKEQVSSKKRGTPYVMIAHVNRFVDEVSISAGYVYNVDKKVRLSIDGTGYNAGLVQDDMAWLNKKDTDKKVIRAMKKGKDLKIEAYGKAGISSADTYSLKGFTKAYRRMKFLCNHVKLDL